MSGPEGGDDSSFKRLLKRWNFVLGSIVLFLISGFALLSAKWEIHYAWRWLVLSAVGITYLLVVLRLNLSSNHRQNEAEILPDFGWGNGLSIIRGVLVAGLAGFLFSPQPVGWIAWLPGLLYILADVCDFFDGYASRITNRVTKLGEVLDISLDGTGVLVASFLAVQYNQVPTWYLAVAAARYVFLGGMWIRRRMGKPNFELTPSTSRRLFAGLQMCFLAVVLLPVFAPPATYIAAAVFALPFLLGFASDWLAVIGVLRPERNLFVELTRKSLEWLPVGVRFVIIGIFAGSIFSILPSMTVSHLQMQAIFLLEILVILLIAIGAAGRIAAILGLLLLGFQQGQTSLAMNQLLLVAAFTMILFLGTGPFSLWKPEEGLISRRAGENRAVQMEGGG